MSDGRVRLRPVTEADLPDYVEWFNDPEVTEFTAAESGNCTLEGEQKWYRKISDPEHPDRHWAIEVEGRHIGNCALMLGRYQETGAFGIVIGDKSAWGKGYGTAALREVLRIGFAELNLHRIHLDAFADNALRPSLLPEVRLPARRIVPPGAMEARRMARHRHHGDPARGVGGAALVGSGEWRGWHRHPRVLDERL